MKRNSLAGWLVLSLLPLLAFTLLSLMNGHRAVDPSPINADQVSAELARSVAYGLVDQDDSSEHRHVAAPAATSHVRPVGHTYRGFSL
jgi:hypothetical protein